MVVALLLIDGCAGCGLMVTVVTELVFEHVFVSVTFTEYSPVVVAVKVADVAEAIAEDPRYHWYEGVEAPVLAVKISV